MSCPICGNKASDCDCTPWERQSYDLEDRVEELEANLKGLAEACEEILKSIEILGRNVFK